MTTGPDPSPPPGQQPTDLPRTSPSGWAKRVVIGLAVAAVGAGVFVCVGIVLWVGGLLRYQPVRTATPESAAAGATWAGFGEPKGLEVVSLYHSVPGDETWAILWKGSPEDVDAFVSSGGLDGGRTRCTSVVLDGRGVTTLDGCEEISGDWRRPGGPRIGRRVTRGRLADGTYVVYLEAFGP